MSEGSTAKDLNIQPRSNKSFRQWYEAHYALPLARKKGAKLTEDEENRINKKRSKRTMQKYLERQKIAAVEPHLIEQFQSGKLLGEWISA